MRPRLQDAQAAKNTQRDGRKKEASQGEAAIEQKIASRVRSPEAPSVVRAGRTVAYDIAEKDPKLSEEASTGKTITVSSSNSSSMNPEKSTGDPSFAIYTRQPENTDSSRVFEKMSNVNYSFVNPWKWTDSRRKARVMQGKLLYEADDEGVYRYYDTSLTWALFWTTWRQLLLSLILASADATMLTTSSLITKRLIKYVSIRHDWSRMLETQRLVLGLPKPKSIAYGVGLAIGLAVMRLASAFFFNHSFAQVSDCGLMMRSAVIDQIARKSLRLSLKSRIQKYRWKANIGSHDGFDIRRSSILSGRTGCRGSPYHSHWLCAPHPQSRSFRSCGESV